MKKTLFLIIIGILCLGCKFKIHKGKNPIKNTTNQTITQNEFPKKKGFINDFEKVFKPEQIIELQKVIDSYSNEFGREIYVVTTSDKYGFENYDKLMRAFSQKWKVGKVTSPKWIIILLSKKNRKFAISTGVEAQKYISDEKINQVIGMKVIPKLKENDFFGGTKSAVEELIKIWK